MRHHANDPDLLNWVQGAAAYGFLQAYHAYVQPLSLSDRDRYYAECVPAAGLYGATGAPTSEAELEKFRRVFVMTGLLVDAYRLRKYTAEFDKMIVEFSSDASRLAEGAKDQKPHQRLGQMEPS